MQAVERRRDQVAPIRRVLVVEDDPDVQALLGTYLDQLGLEASLVGSAEEALVALDLGSFDLVISDILLPGLDGRSLFDTLRAASSTATLPLVAVTVLDPDDVDRRFDAWLSKPFGRNEVARVLAPFLAGRPRP